MRIGVPKEIKPYEYRVGLVPASVREVVAHGHDVIVEAGAAERQGITDADYVRVGAKIVPGAFTSDRYMVTLPKGRSSEARAKFAEIVNEAKKTGVVRKAIEQPGMRGVRVAPN